MALGATSSGISRLVLKSIAIWTLAGALLGIAAAWFGAKLMESLLFAVKPHDPWMMLTALLILSLVALLAAWIPALRASRVEPVITLRHE